MCVLWCEDGKKIHILWSKNDKILKKSIRNCKSTTFHYNDSVNLKKQKRDRGMKEKTNQTDKQTNKQTEYSNTIYYYF